VGVIQLMLGTHSTYKQYNVPQAAQAPLFVLLIAASVVLHAKKTVRMNKNRRKLK